MKSRSRLLIALALAVLALGICHQGDVSAASLKSRVEVVVTGELTSALDLTTVSSPLSLRRALELANGAGAGQANVIWSDQRTLAASTPESLDFAGGGLVDAFGTAVAPARIRALIIYASPANTNNLTLFGDAASILFLNTAATTVTLKPGGMYVFTDPSAAGVVVTGTTADIIKVANAGSGTTVTYDIVVIGSST
jgi:hypothetical protein